MTTFEQAQAWFQSASLSDINSGVGCPFCKHEGPYWVAPCRLHEHLRGVLETAHMNSSIVADSGKQWARLADILELDPDDDLLGVVEDMKAAFDADDVSSGQANRMEGGE